MNSNSARMEDYEIYDDGRVFSHKRKRFLKPSISSSGYETVTLSLTNGSVNRLIHRLVMQHFGPQITNRESFEVNHKDGNKTNNSIANLEYVTTAENAQHAAETGLRKGYRRRVYQYDANGNVIREFESVTEAISELNVGEQRFMDHLNGRRTIENLHCRYAEERQKDVFPTDGIAIPEYENYLATPAGKVYSVCRNQYVAEHRRNGTVYVVIRKDTKPKTCILSSVISAIFLGPKPSKDSVVVHIDDDVYNNAVSNLRYGTLSEIMERCCANKEDAHLRSIVQIDPVTMKTIARFDNSAKAEEESGCGAKQAAIWRCAEGEQFCSDGYFWKYADESITDQHVYKVETTKQTIVRVSADGKEMVIPNRMLAAEVSRCSQFDISECIAGKLETAGGFRWRMAIERKAIKRSRSTEDEITDGRRFTRFDPKTGETKVYTDRVLAAEESHVIYSSIGNCLLGKNIECGGFHWKWLDAPPETRFMSTDTVTGETRIFSTQKEASEHFHCSTGNISACLTGKNKTIHRRYTLKYLTSEFQNFKFDN
jgi:hypothetical protein